MRVPKYASFPWNWTPPIVITIGNSGKNDIKRNFWLGGPIDLNPTHLNYTLQDLFGDTAPHLTAYLSALNIVQWGILGLGIPEKMLQNAA